MTDHVGEGDLQSWLDDELRGEAGDRISRHLERCMTCRERAEELRLLGSRVTSLLSPLEAKMDTGAARWEVRRRRARGRSGREGRSQGMRRWSAAAAVVLLVAAGGAAAALPGSPLRGWLTGSDGNGGAPEPIAAFSTEAGEILSGVAVGLRDGVVEVTLRSAPAGTPVQIRVGEGDRLELQAPEGTRYSSGPGRVEAELEGAVPGSLRILIPGQAREVRFFLDGRPMLTWAGGTFRLEEGIETEAGTEGLTLRLPAPATTGPPPSNPAEGEIR